MIVLLSLALAAAPGTDAPSRDLTGQRGVPGTISELFTDRDYPRSALKKREQGTVRFRLSVDRRGRVSACTILQSSGSAALDGATCRIVQRRARFLPARDEQGNPTADAHDYAITWALPR